MNLTALARSNRSVLGGVVLALGASCVLSFWFAAPFFVAILFAAFLMRVLLNFCAEERSLKQFIYTLFVLAGVLAAASLIIANSMVPYHAWSAIRSAWPAGILRGYDFYYGNSGPIVARMYGPVTPLMYLLSASLNNFVAIVHVGSFLSMLVYFVPVLFIFARYVRSRFYPTVLLIVYMSVFVLLTFVSPALRRAAFTVHADASALGFGAAACLMLIRRKSPSVKDLIFSSLFVALAFWSKSTAIPLALVLPAYVFISYGKKVFKDYLFCLVLTGAISTLIFGWIFNFHKLFYEMFFIPSRQPSMFSEGWYGGALAAIPFLIDTAWMEIVFVVLLLVIYVVLRRTKDFVVMAHWMQGRAWRLFFFVGVCMVPISLLGRMKVGGDLNALSPSVFYWSIAVTIIFVDLCQTSLTQDMSKKKRVLFFVMAMLLFLLNMVMWMVIQDVRRVIYSSPHKISSQVLGFIEKHKGEVYFPTHNLEHLLVEGRMYHNIDGLLDWYHSRVPVEQERLYAFLPADMKFIAIDTVLLRGITGCGSADFFIEPKGLINLLKGNNMADKIIRQELGVAVCELDKVTPKQLIRTLGAISRMHNFYSQIDANVYKPFLDKETQDLLTKAQATGGLLEEQECMQLNRALLEVIYPQKIQKNFHFLERYFPAFHKKIFFADLPDFTVFVQESTYKKYKPDFNFQTLTLGFASLCNFSVNKKRNMGQYSFFERRYHGVGHALILPEKVIPGL